MQAKKYLTKLLAANKTEEVLQILEELSNKMDADLQKEVIIHSANFSKYQEDKEKGILSREEDKITNNQLYEALFDLVNVLPPRLQVKITHSKLKHINLSLAFGKYHRLSRWPLLFILLVSIVLLFVYQIKSQKATLTILTKSIHLNLAQTQILDLDDINLEFADLTITGFENITIESAVLDQSDNRLIISHKENSPNSIIFYPKHNFSDFTIDSSILLSIEDIEPGSDLYIEYPEFSTNEEPEIELVMHSGIIKGNVWVERDVLFQAQQIQMIDSENSGDTINLDYIQGMIKGFTYPLDILFRSDSNGIELNTVLYPSEISLISIGNIEVDNIDFTYLIEEDEESDPSNAQSGIYSVTGKWMDRVTDTQKKDIQLERSLYFNLEPEDDFTINNLKLYNDRAEIRISDFNGKLYSGSENDPILLNPSTSLFQYIYSEKPGLLFLEAGLILLTFITWFRPSKI